MQKGDIIKLDYDLYIKESGELYETTDEELAKRVATSKLKSAAAKKAAKTRALNKEKRETEIYERLKKKYEVVK